ncbi:unnamed protein product [Acanthoscelides obtectus]|uniref:Transposase n=1 Tax=Acanthoscelides obtectus TaxID=200917 RepID=A0A9P0LBY2_ACAOB|nr:unnamed protein product [Acanthoscelides obtectus]CAK1667870.1 Transposable element Tc1 transposase [Acanthoscelides obtectus]
MALQDRKKSSKALAAELREAQGIVLSARSVRRRLVEKDLHGRKARRKPLLTERQKQLRLSWAKTYKDWTAEDWAKVIWTDESNVELFGQPGTRYVRRRPGEAYREECLIPTVKFGGGSIMIWGCMSASGVGEVFLCEGRMTSRRYLDMLEEVLEPSILQLVDTEQGNYFFQQDNAPCHKSREAMHWFEENGVNLLSWPPQSPDLSPIENLWHIVKSKIAQHHCASKTALKEKIVEEWNAIPAATCLKLVSSMPRRVKLVIKAGGGSIKY